MKKIPAPQAKTVGENFSSAFMASAPTPRLTRSRKEKKYASTRNGMSRHEIARMVEVSSPLFAPGTEVRIVADWLMRFSRRFLLFVGSDMTNVPSIAFGARLRPHAGAR